MKSVIYIFILLLLSCQANQKTPVDNRPTMPVKIFDQVNLRDYTRLKLEMKKASDAMNIDFTYSIVLDERP